MPGKLLFANLMVYAPPGRTSPGFSKERFPKSGSGTPRIARVSCKKNYGPSGDSFMPRKLSAFSPVLDRGVKVPGTGGAPEPHEPRSVICPAIWTETASGVRTSLVPTTSITSLWMPERPAHDPFHTRLAWASRCSPGVAAGSAATDSMVPRGFRVWGRRTL